MFESSESTNKIPSGGRLSVVRHQEALSQGAHARSARIQLALSGGRVNTRLLPSLDLYMH